MLSSTFVYSSKLPSSTLYFSKLSLYVLYILPSAIRKPLISPITAVINTNITKYFAISPVNSLGRRLFNGFFILSSYHSRLAACILFLLTILSIISPSLNFMTLSAIFWIASL